MLHVVIWINVAIISPIFVYASLVWFVKMRVFTQRIYTRKEFMPRHYQHQDIFIQNTGRSTAHRLICEDLSEYNGCEGHKHCTR